MENWTRDHPGMPDTHEYATSSASKRCAVYTRVSVDDGNNEEIGSTDVQLMACHELSAKGIFELMLELLDESYLRQVTKRWADCETLNRTQRSLA